MIAGIQTVNKKCTRCGSAYTLRPDYDLDRYCLWCGAVEYRPRRGVRPVKVAKWNRAAGVGDQSRIGGGELP